SPAPRYTRGAGSLRRRWRWRGCGSQNANIPHVYLTTARVHANAAHAVAASLEANVPVRAGGDVEPPISIRVAVVPRRIALTRTRDKTHTGNSLTNARVDHPAPDASEGRGHQRD